MTVNTGNHQAIKLRPYGTPFQNREFIDNTVEETFDVNIVCRSHSHGVSSSDS